MGLISNKMMIPSKSLLHPIANSKQPAGFQPAKEGPKLEEAVNVNGGYKAAIVEISSRFDVNNRELNKRKFNDQYGHILNASKAKGAKFTKKEVSMSLTPPFADQINRSDQKASG